MVYRSTNNHLYNQWSYEIQLMNVIVRHEGGRGIKIAEDKKTKKKERDRERVEAIHAATQAIKEKAEENNGNDPDGSSDTEDPSEPVKDGEKMEGENDQ